MPSLTILTLQYLSVTAYRAKQQPIPRSLELRVALAYLHLKSRAGREPFDAFWQAVTDEADNALMADYYRVRDGHTALAQICRLFGLQEPP